MSIYLPLNIELTNLCPWDASKQNRSIFMYFVKKYVEVKSRSCIDHELEFFYADTKYLSHVFKEVSPHDLLRWGTVNITRRVFDWIEIRDRKNANGGFFTFIGLFLFHVARINSIWVFFPHFIARGLIIYSLKSDRLIMIKFDKILRSQLSQCWIAETWHDISPFTII